MYRLPAVILLSLFVPLAPAAPVPTHLMPKPASPGMFEKEVLPIFRAKCLKCHGAVGRPKGGLDLRTLAAIAKGGDNGVSLKGGDLKQSLIWVVIGDGAMPPEGQPQLTTAEMSVIKKWIVDGAK